MNDNTVDVKTSMDRLLSIKNASITSENASFDLIYNGDSGKNGNGQFYVVTISDVIINGKEYTPFDINAGKLKVNVDERQFVWNNFARN